MQTPPLSLTLTLAFTCCALGGVWHIVALGISVSRKLTKEEEKGVKPLPSKAAVALTSK